MIQGSNEWLMWRRLGICSSDAPQLMGCSPWGTPTTLWLNKTGRVGEKVSNFAMQRGINLEPKARAMYELKHGIEMPAALCVHPKYDFIRASLDGHNPELRKVLEIKCPGKVDHALAVSGQVPEKYKWQIVLQLLAADALTCDYWSFDGAEGVRIVVPRDYVLEDILLKASRDFWHNHVLTDTPPPFIAQDFKQIKKKDFVMVFERYKKCRAEYEQTHSVLQVLEQQLKAISGNVPTECAGVRVIGDSIQVVQ